ncbi:MAG: polyprenyl synthetase family protein [Alphaproteobacteria bacterium]|nr:polyprenyl synthetase family protein [Alphaproteobacteria bacterium]
MDISTTLKEYSERFNQTLPSYFTFSQGQERRVIEAMSYSIMNGGKRLRPFLVYHTAKLFGISFEQSINTAVALECLHSYSLIHDDLPAMDNDDLRRGKPTCHKAFDEATAILAGDGLLTYAFELLSQERTHPNATIRTELISALAKGAGAYEGMVAGQMLDLLAEKNKATLEPETLIKHIEEMKTGQLISFACLAGAILGQASSQQRLALQQYSRGIGIAFQITDDILDVIGDQTLMGKTLGKDQNQGKITFVSLYGLEKAKTVATDLIKQAQQALEIFGNQAETLKALAQFILNRDH